MKDQVALAWTGALPRLRAPSIESSVERRGEQSVEVEAPVLGVERGLAKGGGHSSGKSGGLGCRWVERHGRADRRRGVLFVRAAAARVRRRRRAGRCLGARWRACQSRGQQDEGAGSARAAKP